MLFASLIEIKISNFFFLQAVVAVELENKESIYGYHKNTKIPFLKITVALQKLVAPSRRLLEQGFVGSSYEKNYRTFESNIDFEVSLFRISDLVLKETK